MSKSITIDNLSTIEKIGLKEKSWDDLSSTFGYAPPNWHGEELARRKNAAKKKGKLLKQIGRKLKKRLEKISHDYSDS